MERIPDEVITHEGTVQVMDDGSIFWHLRGQEVRTYLGDTFTVNANILVNDDVLIRHTVTFYRPKDEAEV